MHTGKIRNIIFDLGNTLVYFDECYFYDGIAKLEKKLRAGSLKRYIIDKKLDRKMISGKLKHKDMFRILKNRFDLKIGYSDFSYIYADIFWENTQMRKFLEKISRIKKYRLYLLSNTDAPHMNFIDNNFPFVRIIRNRILSFRIGMYKPQLRIFRYVLNKYRLKPSQTLLIDDIKENVEAAKSLGIKTIHYRKHSKFIKEFSQIIKSS